MIRATVLLAFVVVSVELFGQQKSLSDTVITLPPFKKVGIAKRAENIGFQVQEIDSNTIQHNLSNSVAEVLSSESQIQIKSYGNSMLASSSYRGLAARHTGVYWNGININQAGIGMIDLNLVPVFAADKISIWQGGGSALLGTGNMAGSIHLSNQPNFKKETKLSYNQAIGSFGLHSETGNLQIGTSKISSQTAVQYKAARNDYTYINPSIEKAVLDTQSNAAFHKINVMQNLSFNFEKAGLLSLHYWYENTFREIPPTLAEISSNATQQDISHKGIVSWKNTFNKWKVQVSAADLWDKLIYNDTISHIFSNYTLNTAILKAGIQRHFGKYFQYYLNVASHFSNIKNTNYTDSSLNRYLLEGSTGISGQFIKKKLTTAVDIGFSQNNVMNSPVSPSFGAKFHLNKYLTLRGNASYNFTFPTFNDLYWTPGGNPNLLPEQGWAYEGGAELHFRRSKKYSDKLYFTAYSQKIENWIAWIPSDKGYWAPINYKKVWSRGVEMGWQSFYKIKKSRFKLNVNYSYTLATNESIDKTNDLSLHRQLIYVPYYKGNTTLTYSYKHFQILINAIYNGAQFATSDNTTLMPAYWLFNSGAFYNFYVSKLKFSAGLKLNNITNKFYQPLLGYIMPGRNFEANLKITFK